MMKKIIVLVVLLILISAGIYVIVNVESWGSTTINNYLGKLLPSDFYSKFNPDNYITTESGEQIKMLIKYNHSNTSLFDDNDDLTYDQELLCFYSTVCSELNEIGETIVATDMDINIAFNNANNDNFYLTASCKFSKNNRQELDEPYIYELEEVYIYVPNEHGQVEKDLIKITKDETLIYNDVIYLSDLFYESSNDIATTQVVVAGELMNVDLKTISYYVTDTAGEKKIISYDHTDDVIRLTSSLMADLFTIDYPNNNNEPAIKGFVFNDENFEKLANGVYPDFDNSFTQNNPISQLLFDAVGEFDNINVEHLGVTMNYVDTTTYSDIKLMLMFDLNTPFYYDNNIMDTTKVAEVDDIVSLDLYHFVNGKWTIVKSSGTGTISEMPNLENCIYGTTSSSTYDCYVFSDDSLLGGHVLNIGTSYPLLEHDLPGHLFDYIYETMN